MVFFNILFGGKSLDNDAQRVAPAKVSSEINADVESYIIAARECKKNNDIKTAMDWYRKAADNGHGEACYFMAQYYMEGKIVSKSESRAFEYYKRSAELGDEAGQAYLGMFYLDGIGTTKDEKAAFFWLSKCPDIDWSGLGLSKCYIYGKGINRDVNKGIKILMNIAKPHSSNVFVKEARQLARDCAKQGLPVPHTFLEEINEADKRESELFDELIASFDDSEFTD